MIINTWLCFSLYLSFSCCNLDFSSQYFANMSTTLSLSPANAEKKNKDNVVHYTTPKLRLLKNNNNTEFAVTLLDQTAVLTTAE